MGDRVICCGDDSHDAARYDPRIDGWVKVARDLSRLAAERTMRPLHESGRTVRLHPTPTPGLWDVEELIG